MNAPRLDLACKLLENLRKELVETQRIRAQVIGFKITFVSAAIGLIVAHIDRMPPILFVVPAFASMFFDLLINSYSVSIARIGFYGRNHIEPILRAEANWPNDNPLWEEFLARPKSRTQLSIVGNLGLTGLAAVAGFVGLALPFRTAISIPLGVCLVLLFIYDAKAHYHAGKVVSWQLHPMEQWGDAL